MIDFPANPTVGEEFTDPASGATWTWDGVKWTAAGLNVAYLPLRGGTMLGPLVLEADPTAPLEPVTLQMFDRYPMIGDSRIINGDMRIDQRNAGASGSGTSTYTIDRWYYSSTQPAKGTWGRNVNAVASPPGFPYYWGFQSSSTYVLTATDNFFVRQYIEADMVSDFAWGTPNAQPVTLSFWAYSNQTGTFSGSIVLVPAGTRSYPFQFSIPVANTWTKITITIPGDTAGAWSMSGSGASVGLLFNLGSGTNSLGPANVWATAFYAGATGSVQVAATNAATFYVTGVKLEIGTVATPYNRQSLAKSMADCQRYFEKSFSSAVGSPLALNTGEMFGISHNSSGIYRAEVPFKVTKRAAPTILIYDNNGVAGNVSYYISTWATGSPTWSVVPTGAIAGFYSGYALAGVIETQFGWTASAEL
jgi:hypothetical protein